MLETKQKKQVEITSSGLDRVDPITLNFSGILTITNEILDTISRQNSPYQFERTAKGELRIMSPTHSETGRINLIIASALFQWNKAKNLGVCFDSSTGFELPNRAILSPDASWIKNDRWDGLTKKEKNDFAPVVPDFVIEIKSRSNTLKSQKDKMTEWMTNGCKLAWLIDPLKEKAYIYRPDKEIEEVSSFSEKLSGEDVLPHFVLDLSELIEEE